MLWVVIWVWCYYVNKKWFGGMLINWFIIEKRFYKFRDLRIE
ncbi:hypothetical protein GCM10009504_47580 [Pseudomonas laurentiana]|nr:hypothetical protein GCM10009504_47580 [Pseudomonas laurentiana]